MIQTLRFNILSILFFLITTSIVFAQTFTIKGVIRDAKTSEIVPFANVFIANTTKGTSSNEKGEYTLSKIPFGTVIVSVSMVGYAPARQTIRVETEGTKEVDFTINPIEQELSEVKVSANRDKTWEKQFQRFSKSILGDSPLSKLCNIKNSYLIDFDDTKGALKAFAKQPIEIENLALGYRMFFTLTNYVLANEEIQYQGYARFEELKPVSEKEASKWKQNRLMAFEGSDRHLFWALAQRKLKPEGYEAFVDAAGFNPANRTANFYGQLGKSILAYPLDSIVRKGKIATEYRIRFPKRIELHFASPYYNGQFYRDDIRMISWIESLKDLDFNDRGIIQNPKDLVISGFMSSKRLAEMLPLDYLPNENVEREIPKEKINVSVDSTTQRSIWRLQERVQLISNKAYYHPNENLWFAGRMHYADATMSDSISKVVYVEWISPQNELIARQKHHVDSLQFKGMIALPNELALGNYRIRAYTQWMRNFGDSCFYEQIIPIISPKQFIVSNPKSLSKASFSIKTDKNIYQKREKISMTIEGSENKNLTISVTDTFAVRSCNAILSSKNVFLPPSFFKILPEFKYLAETGLKLSGKVLDKNDKPTLANIVFYFGQNQIPLTTQTDAEGRFSVAGIQLHDTTDISYQATDLKGKLLGKVFFDAEDFPAIKPSKLKPIFELKNLPSAVLVEKNLDLLKDAIALDETSVKAKRLENQVSNKPIYGSPDHVVYMKDLGPALIGMNPVLALQGKVPGLQVSTGVDGVIKVRVRGGQNSFSGDSAPLFLLDGFPVENERALMNVNMANIDRIEVISVARSIFGTRGANGVIALYTKSSITKQSDQNLSGLKPSTKQLTMIGYHDPKPFFSPNYSTAQAKESTKIDIRTTLFWQPNLSSNTFSFYAADNASIYRILVSNGTETAEAFVEVKK